MDDNLVGEGVFDPDASSSSSSPSHVVDAPDVLGSSNDHVGHDHQNNNNYSISLENNSIGIADPWGSSRVQRSSGTPDGDSRSSSSSSSGHGRSKHSGSNGNEDVVEEDDDNGGRVPSAGAVGGIGMGSAEFVNLVNAQFDVLASMLGASQIVLYVRRENSETGEQGERKRKKREKLNFLVQKFACAAIQEGCPCRVVCVMVIPNIFDTEYIAEYT